MKKSFIIKSIKIVAFLMCALIIFISISAICERKTTCGAWNYMAKVNEFYSLEEDSLDYIGVGSSHMYCSLNPLEVWNESGATGFLLSTQQQPLIASYHYIKEAFKTQSPKYVVVEALMLGSNTNYDSAVLYDAIDPLKLSFNKIQMINNLVEYDERPEYYFNILKYHTRWNEITPTELSETFQKPKDYHKGFVALDGEFEGQNRIPNYEATPTVPLTESNVEILNKIYDLISQNNAQMILMVGPYDTSNTTFCEQIKAGILWANEKNIPVLDYALMLNDIGVEPRTDYYDAGHLDVSGAAKLSIHFATFLKEQGLQKNPNVKTENWKTDYNKYKTSFKEDFIEAKKDREMN